MVSSLYIIIISPCFQASHVQESHGAPIFGGKGRERTNAGPRLTSERLISVRLPRANRRKEKGLQRWLQSEGHKGKVMSITVRLVFDSLNISES